MASWWQNVQNNLGALGNPTYGSMAPQAQQQANMGAFTNIGAQMLRNSNQNPMQAVGGALSNQQQQGGMNMRQQMAAQLFKQNQDKAEAEQEKTKREGAAWQQLSGPLASKLGVDPQALSSVGMRNGLMFAKTVSGGGGKATSAMQNFQYYQNLLKTDPDAAAQFLKQSQKGQTINNILPGQGSKGMVEADKEFGKEYTKFMMGGASDVQRQMAQLGSVIDDIDAGKPISGPGVGLMALFGDTAQSIANPEAQSAKERVAEVTQRNLRLILGAQFTEKEGEALINRTFNPALGPKENRRRVRALLEQMNQAFNAKKAMIEYFGKNGNTLSGYKGEWVNPNVFRDLFKDEQQSGGGEWTIEEIQ
jgi:hypothetical protein